MCEITSQMVLFRRGMYIYIEFHVVQFGPSSYIVLHTKPIKRGNGYSQLDITIYSKELWKISAWNISFHNLMLRTETDTDLCASDYTKDEWRNTLNLLFLKFEPTGLGRWSLSPPRKWAWRSQINDNCVTSCVCVLVALDNCVYF